MGKKSRRAKLKKRRGETPASSISLSLCMIVRDEAGFLEQCLAHVKDMVDEIVVVDTGSTDDSVAIARRFGARIHQQRWNNDFSEARNRALESARGQWILCLDCDELIAPKDWTSITSLLKRTGVDAYRFTTRNYSDQPNQTGWTACDGEYEEERGHPGWFPTSKVRMWRNRRQFRFQGAVHELVETAILEHGGHIADCLVPVHHYGYVEKERSEDRYLEAGQRKAGENPNDLQARYELAIALRNADRFEDGLREIEFVLEHLNEAGAQFPYLEEELARLIHADLLNRLGHVAAAEEAYRSILGEIPESYQALNNLGLLLERRGSIGEARECYARGVKSAPDNQVLKENLARLEGSGSATDQRLSVCIIARNEEQVLERCLKSVASVADEIIVVDTGSTDGTLGIAARYGATIDQMPWRDDFAAARNRSLEMASCEWILWLDADDYLLPEDRNRVRQATSLSLDQAFYFTLVNEGHDSSSFRQVKMFPNHPEVRFERSVHESVVPALERLGIPIRVTDAQVRHTGYAEPEVTQRKQRYYLELMQAWMRTHPEDQYIRFRVGHTYYSQGDRGVAKEHFLEILNAGCDQTDSLSTFRSALVFQGRCLLEDGGPRAAIPHFEQAFSFDANDALINMSLGDVFTKLGEYEKAIVYLETATKGTVDPHFPVDEKVVQYSANFFLGQCLEASGKPSAAIGAFSRAAEVDPERSEARQALLALRGSASPEVAVESREPIQPPPSGSGSRISLCMIVRDEEEKLPRCLENVASLVDEIVLVDTGSSDRTVEIAKEYGARTGFFAWCDDFAAARNESLKLATGDWILWLDADDILEPEYHDQIRHLVQQPRDRSFLFVLDDRGYEHISCLQMRLFPNLEGVQFEMPIHEQVTPSLGRLGVEMVPTEIRVRHTGYTTPEIVKAKKDRYLGIMEQWLVNNPDDYITRSHVALTYHSGGRHAEAIDAYSKIVHESSCLSDRNYVVYTTALLFLGRSFMKAGDHGRALEYMCKAQEVDPEYLLTKVSLAELYIARGEYQDALVLAGQIVDSEPQLTFFPVDPVEITFSAHYLRAQAHHALGQVEEAEREYRLAAEQPAPRRTEALGNLAVLLKELDRRDESLETLLTARKIDPDNIKHDFNIGVHYLESKNLENARTHFKAVLEKRSDYRPAILNLGYIAKATGAFDEAEEIYSGLVAVAPDEVEARANLGHLYLDQERFLDARTAFEELRQLDPNLLDINLGLLLAVARLEDWVAAKQLAQEVVKLFSGAIELRGIQSGGREIGGALVQLGRHLTNEGQPKCAEFCYATATLVDDGDMEAKRCLGEIYWHQGAYWKAVSQYEALLLSDPRDGTAFQRLGDCYQRLGVKDAAELCYAKSAEVTQG